MGAIFSRTPAKAARSTRTILLGASGCLAFAASLGFASAASAQDPGLLDGTYSDASVATAQAAEAAAAADAAAAQQALDDAVAAQAALVADPDVAASLADLNAAQAGVDAA